MHHRLRKRYSLWQCLLLLAALPPALAWFGYVGCIAGSILYHAPEFGVGPGVGDDRPASEKRSSNSNGATRSVNKDLDLPYETDDGRFTNSVD